MKNRFTGVQLITIERERQINEEGWTPEHDDEHENGEMGLMASLYATPILLYCHDKRKDGVWFHDPYISLVWDEEWDERKRSVLGNIIQNKNFPTKQRIRNLVKAGALIAAEIDRLQRLEK